MRNVAVSARLAPSDAPDDLIVFQFRMGNAGVNVRLPASGARFAPLDPPLPITAEQWAEEILARRGTR